MTGEKVYPDIASYEARRNPYPTYQQMMGEGSVHWHEGTQGWYILHYEDVANGLRDNRYSANRLQPVYQRLPAIAQEKYQFLFGFLSHWTLLLDPPEHTKLRKLLSASFAPRLINALRPKVQLYVDQMIEAALPKGQMNLIADFSYPLPATIIAEMLGVPMAERDKCREWSDVIAGFFGAQQMTPDVISHTQDGLQKMHQYFRDLLAVRRQDPQEDLITSLAHTEVDGERLSDEEIIASCAMLIFGGHETTMNLIANAMVAFLQNPAQIEALLAEPSLIENAIEEALRYDAPVQRITRASTAETVLGGKVIPAAQRIFFMLGAANRDPRQFEAPDAFDIRRQNVKHISLGYGLHYCLGATLGRMEAQVAVLGLLQRLHGLRLAQPVVYVDNHSFHAPQEVALAFQAHS
jgi:cytochrome P450